MRGALAEAVGRLPYKDAQGVRQAERAIVGALKPSKPPGPEPSPARDVPAEKLEFASPATLLGGLRGLEAFARAHAKTATLEPATITLLEELAVAWRSAVARAEGGPTAEAAARLRRLPSARWPR